jgi:hypothetical protein
MMQVTVFMAGFMARLWCLVKGRDAVRRCLSNRSSESIEAPNALSESTGRQVAKHHGDPKFC